MWRCTTTLKAILLTIPPCLPASAQAELGVGESAALDRLRPQYVAPLLSSAAPSNLPRLNQVPNTTGEVPRLGNPQAIGQQTRIVLHSRDSSAPLLASLQGRLASLGAEDVTTRQIELHISRHQVRYFHDADLREATAIASALESLLGGVELRDFTSFRPAPSNGLVEIWLPD